MNRGRIIVAFLVSLLLVTLFFVLFSLVLYVSRFWILLDDEGDHFGQKYKRFQSKPQAEDGLSKVFNINQNGQFSAGDNSVVSEFGFDEYECVGSCYCDDEFRRSSTVPIVRGLKYLVAAATSLVAISLSKSYFDEKCMTELADVCSIDNVHSEIESCEDIVSVHLLKEDEEEIANLQAESAMSIEEEEEQEKANEENKKRYSCSGDCVHDGLTVRDYLMTNILNIFSEFSFSEKNIWLISCGRFKKLCPKMNFKNFVFAINEQVAEEHFRDFQLHPYCQAESTFKSQLKLSKSKHPTWKIDLYESSPARDRSFCAGYVIRGSKLKKRSEVTCHLSNQVGPR